MRLKILLVFIFSCCFNVLSANDTLRLVFMGDIMQHLTQINAAKTADGSYSYDSCFSFIAPEIQNADFAAANLELTLAGPPYSGFPRFSAPDDIAKTLKNIGIDLLTNANNHCCDRGKKGLVRTLDVLDDLDILHVGTYRHAGEKAMLYPRIVDVKGFRLAFVSYTYGTNGMPIAAPTVVNLIDTAQISKDYELAQQYNPDIVICIIHWGEEYHLNPSREQKMLAEFFFQKGIPVVIGSHPHVIQPMESRLDDAGNIKASVFYSLGNVVSNQNDEHTDIGALAHVTLVKNGENTSISDCSYSLIWRYRIKNPKREYYIIPAGEFYDNENFCSPSDFKSFRQIVDKTRKRLTRDNINLNEKSSKSK